MNRRIKHCITMVVRSWVGSILIAVLIATTFKSVVADWYVVPTGSMKPTIVEGDRIFANKLAYGLRIPYSTWSIARWEDPQRGEIVVFDSPADDKCLVKRVVGVPGDTIAMNNNQLLINGFPLAYEAIEKSDYYDSLMSGRDAPFNLYREDLVGTEHPVMITPSIPSHRSFGPITLPPGHFWMMGDNRDNSADSRYFGPVNRSNILGRATHVVISLDKTHYYKPRWERFFSALP